MGTLIKNNQSNACLGRGARLLLVQINCAEKMTKLKVDPKFLSVLLYGTYSYNTYLGVGQSH